MPSPVIHAKVVFERYNVRAHSTRLQSPAGVKSPREMCRSELVTRDSGGGWIVTVHAPTGSLDAGWGAWMQIWPLQHSSRTEAEGRFGVVRLSLEAPAAA